MEIVNNVQNEFMFVGAIYNKPDLLVECEFIRSKYDFFDPATKFFYDCAEIIYKTRSESLSETAVLAFMTEDKERKEIFKNSGKMEAIRSWKNLGRPEDFQKYFDILKKYSLLREYQRNGFNIEKLMALKNFEELTATDVTKAIRGKAEQIHTVIMDKKDTVILNEGMTKLVKKYMEIPDMGLPLPFPILNDLFRGMKTETMWCLGMLSNCGKSRFMFKLIAYMALALKERVCVLLNEMTIDRMQLCLLVTVLNNEEFQALHGIKITKREKEIALGLYKSESGELIYRKKDQFGNFLEDEKTYEQRIEKLSPECKKVMQVANWIETETDGLIYALDVSTDYCDKTLEIEIKKKASTNGIKYFFYDTLKQDSLSMGDWAALKATATKLSELTRELKCFIYASIQLTDDAIYLKPDELTSACIANAKQMKHVLDNLLLVKEISDEEKSHYHYMEYSPEWGEPVKRDLDRNKRYYIFNIDKNRDGSKESLIFEINLDLNTWYELGVATKQK